MTTQELNKRIEKLLFDADQDARNDEFGDGFSFEEPTAAIRQLITDVLAAVVPEKKDEDDFSLYQNDFNYVIDTIKANAERLLGGETE